MDKDLYNFTTELIDALNNTEDLYGFLFTVQTINAAGTSIETLEVRSEDGSICQAFHPQFLRQIKEKYKMTIRDVVYYIVDEMGLR